MPEPHKFHMYYKAAQEGWKLIKNVDCYLSLNKYFLNNFWSNIFEDHKSLAFARYKTQPLPKSIDSVEQKLEAIKLPSFLLKTSSLGTFSRLWAKEGFEIWRNCKIQNIQNGLYGHPQRGQGINLNILRSNLFSNWHSKKSQKTFVCKRLVWWDWVTMQI